MGTPLATCWRTAAAFPPLKRIEAVPRPTGMRLSPVPFCAKRRPPPMGSRRTPSMVDAFVWSTKETPKLWRNGDEASSDAMNCPERKRKPPASR